MDRDINVLDYLPSVMMELLEFQALASTENPEITSLWSAIDDIINDQFVNDATENGVKRWESMLEISPKGSDSLDVRKFRIISRLNEELPYSYRKLEQQLRTLCGDAGYSLLLQGNTYTLTVRVDLSAKGKYDEVDALLRRVVPANIVIDLSLLYNQHKALAHFTHGHLRGYTHKQLRNEVIT